MFNGPVSLELVPNESVLNCLQDTFNTVQLPALDRSIMTSLVDMPNPLPLIVDDDHGKISVVKETYDIIGNIDKPVIAVAMWNQYIL